MTQASVRTDQDWQQAYPQFLEDWSSVRYSSLPRNLTEGGGGCGHNVRYQLTWNTTFCGLCFLKLGYREELPKRLHQARLLADNGNPEQSDAFLSHVQVVEGFIKPRPNQSLRHFRRARVAIYGQSHPPSSLFPFASALWDLMGYQPPLAEPLIQAVAGLTEVEIAFKMDLSIFNVVGRLTKGIHISAHKVRSYHDRRR